MEQQNKVDGNSSQPAQTVVKEFIYFNVLEDGQIQFKPPMHIPIVIVPPCSEQDSDAPVISKDITISTSPLISARIFLPRSTPPATKLPVLVYFHGGGFMKQSPFSDRYHAYVTNLVAEANIIAVSVDYGLYPARPLLDSYNDSWASLNWVAAHANDGGGPEPWLNRHADFQRVFIGGDSAGANITHTVAVRVGREGLPGRVKVSGAFLIHPYFGGVDVVDEMWLYFCPKSEGPDYRKLKPAVEDLACTGCEKVLVFVGEKDIFCGAGKAYCELLMKSGWPGTMEMVENLGKDHCWHLFESEDEQAVSNMTRVASFINS